MTTENYEVYKELLERIIESAKYLYGELAIKIASRINGLEVSLDGKVTGITGAPQDILQHLLSEYEALGGKMFKKLNDVTLEAYCKRYPQAHLPKL